MVRVVECGEPAELLAALASFKGEVDFVWCLPDGSLYNSATEKPISGRRSSREARISGLMGQAVRSPGGPRRLRVVVNQSVLRLMGLRYVSPAPGDGEFSVLP
jgi:hypothetical protein